MTMQFKRHVSLLLSFVIAMMLLPVFGTAQELLDQEIETQPMIHEVTSLREKYVKHFALPDGTYQAVTYSEPVHELDANGQWQDIDNTLQLVNTKGVESYFNANSGIAFAKSFSPNQTLFSIDDGNYAISMSVLQGTSGVEVMSTAAISSEAFVNNANPRIADVFSSVEEADLILIMDNGKIVARGNHAELMESSVGAKSVRAIRSMVRVWPLRHRFTLPSILM